MSRRFVLLFVLVALLVPSETSAAVWRQYQSSALHFALRYPPGWHVISAQQVGVTQVMLTYQSHQIYSMTVAVLPIKSGSSKQQTINRFVQFEARHAGSAQFGQIHWSSVKVGGKAGSGGVFSPPTEGGIALSQGIYLIPWRSHLYEIALGAYSKHSLSGLRQFPSVYRQILQTWRFL